ncbi:MAG: TIGR00725 family protein [Acidimicrobiales bacterium]
MGPSQSDPDLDRVAEQIGKQVAEAEAVLVCGGLGGAMESACRGAARAGGMTIGILPGHERADANRWVAIAVPTGLGELRNALIVRTADVIIALGGGYGTLSEIALALRLGVPVVGVGTWDLVEPNADRVPAIVRTEAESAVSTALGLSGRLSVE